MKITYVNLPDDTPRRLPFYLAMEEYLARHSMSDSCCFFMWQVNPTVIFGRNQVIDREVDLDYCRRHGIEFYRRKSGGGCVFANQDNIMFSYITPSASDIETTFSAYTGLICDMLRSLGLDAEPSDRNDILISGRKVSGNAFYHLPERDIIHGTMLFDTDREQMSRAITPSKSKLDAKGVASVKSRVTTIREHLDISIRQFKSHVRQWMTNGNETTLSADDVEQIAQMEQSYYDAGWIYRRTKASLPAGTVDRRIEGVGEITASVATDRANIITGVQLAGDFFQSANGEELLTERLAGVKYSPADIKKALHGFSAANVAAGLTDNELIEILLNQ